MGLAEVRVEQVGSPAPGQPEARGGALVHGGRERLDHNRGVAIEDGDGRRLRRPDPVLATVRCTVAGGSSGDRDRDRSILPTDERSGTAIDTQVGAAAGSALPERAAVAARMRQRLGNLHHDQRRGAKSEAGVLVVSRAAQGDVGPRPLDDLAGPCIPAAGEPRSALQPHGGNVVVVHQHLGAGCARHPVARRHAQVRAQVAVALVDVVGLRAEAEQRGRGAGREGHAGIRPGMGVAGDLLGESGHDLGQPGNVHPHRQRAVQRTAAGEAEYRILALGDPSGHRRHGYARRIVVAHGDGGFAGRADAVGVGGGYRDQHPAVRLGGGVVGGVQDQRAGALAGGEGDRNARSGGGTGGGERGAEEGCVGEEVTLGAHDHGDRERPFGCGTADGEAGAGAPSVTAAAAARTPTAGRPSLSRTGITARWSPAGV